MRKQRKERSKRYFIRKIPQQIHGSFSIRFSGLRESKKRGDSSVESLKKNSHKTQNTRLESNKWSKMGG